MKTKLDVSKKELDKAKDVIQDITKELDILKSLIIIGQNGSHCDTAKVLAIWQTKCENLERHLADKDMLISSLIDKNRQLDFKLAEILTIDIDSPDLIKKERTELFAKILKYEEFSNATEFRNTQLKQTIKLLRSLITSTDETPAIQLFDAHRYIADFQVQIWKLEKELEEITKQRDNLLNINENQNVAVMSIKTKLQNISKSLLNNEVDHNKKLLEIQQENNQFRLKNEKLMDDLTVKDHETEELKTEVIWYQDMMTAYSSNSFADQIPQSFKSNYTLKAENSSRERKHELECIEKIKGVLSEKQVQGKVDNTLFELRKLKLENKNEEDDLSKSRIRNIILKRSNETLKENNGNLWKSYDDSNISLSHHSDSLTTTNETIEKSLIKVSSDLDKKNEENRVLSDKNKSLTISLNTINHRYEILKEIHANLVQKESKSMHHNQERRADRELIEIKLNMIESQILSDRERFRAVFAQIQNVFVSSKVLSENSIVDFDMEPFGSDDSEKKNTIKASKYSLPKDNSLKEVIKRIGRLQKNIEINLKEHNKLQNKLLNIIMERNIIESSVENFKEVQKGNNEESQKTNSNNAEDGVGLKEEAKEEVNGIFLQKLEKSLGLADDSTRMR